MKTAELLMEMYKRLYDYFGPQHWWPAETKYEVVVGAVLTQNTAWKNVEKAINLFEKVLEMATDRELQLKAVAVELLNFVMSHDYENMEKVLKKRLKVNSPEELKRLILNFPENLANFLINVYHAYKRFYEAKDFFNQGRGRELLEAIKKELKDGGISYSRITYEIDWDYEEPVKLPLIYVRLTREYPQELLRKINKKLVEEFFFKKGLNFMLLFQGG